MTVGKHVAGNANKVMGINLSAPYICTEFKDKLVEFMPYVDILFGNDDEYKAFGKAMGWGEDLKTIGKNIAAMPKARGDKRTVVITEGSNPVIVYHGEEMTTYEVPKLADDRFVDRNGAGDAFVGGFLANMYRGKNLAESTRLAIKCAEVVMQHLGCTFPAEKPDMDKMIC